MARFLAGRYGRRLAHLEELDGRAQVKHLGERWLAAIDQLTDEELLLTLRVFDRYTNEGRQERLAVEAAVLGELEGTEHAAWAAYISVGASAIEDETMKLLEGLPEDEHEQLLKGVWEDPSIRERLRALPSRYWLKYEVAPPAGSRRSKCWSRSLL